jgi:hypothetical protein
VAASEALAMRPLALFPALLASLALAAPARADESEQPVPPPGVVRVADAAAVAREVAYSVARANHYDAWRFLACRRVSTGRVSCRYALRRASTVETYRIMVYAVDTVPGDSSTHFLNDAPVFIRTATAKSA